MPNIAVPLTLGGVSSSRRVGTDQRKARGGFQRDGLRHRLGRRCARDIAIGERAVVPRMADHPARDLALRRAHLPVRGSGADKHDTGRRGGLAQAYPVGAGRGGAAGRLVAEQRILVFGQIGRGRLHLDLIKAKVELLRHQHRGAGVDALAHLGMRRDEDDLADGRHADEGVGHEGGFRRSGGPRKAQADQQPAARHQHRFQDQPAGRMRAVHRRLRLGRRRGVDRCADAHIGAATADIAGQRRVDIGVARPGRAVE